MRVSGTSHGVNSRQNDKRTKKRKNGTPAAAEKHGLGGAGGQRPVAPHLARGRMPLVASINCFAPDLPAWLARVGRLPDETRPGGHRKPRAACGPVEGRVIDDTLAASPWPIKARIPDSFRIISDTATSSIPSSKRPPTQHGSKSCGGEPKRRPAAHFMAATRIAVLRLSEIAQ